MFSRRKHRTAHATAYTGVNHAPQPAQAPSHNAMAAALTIGQSLKDPSAPQGQVRRLASFQTKPNQTIGRLGSVRQLPQARQVPRLPSINQGRRMDHYKQPPGTDSRRSSFQNVNGNHDNSSFNDSFGSFNDSFNDHAVSDLKLSDPNNVPVRMVKKYIPTPTGIKVVEVPETNFAKEVARSNSLRSGPNMYRSGSLNSLSQNLRIPRLLSLTGKPPQQSSSAVRQSLRLSSLQGAKGMSSMVEEEEAVDTADDVKDHQKKLEALQKQIDNEKKMARELEEMKSEFERLKAERLRKEQAILELDQEKDLDTHAPTQPVESEEEDVPIVEPPFAVDELAKKELRESSSPILRPDLGTVEDTLEDNLSEKSSVYEAEVIPDASIDANAVTVDELDKKNAVDENSAPDHEQSFSTLDPATGAELGIINHYAPSPERDGETELVSVPDLPDPLLDASMLKPQFDPSPEYIDSDDSKNIADLLHLPPPINNVSSSNSSVRSGGTFDSSSPHKSALKPKKSAIKNSNSFYNSSLQSAPRAQNPAREAYLSLTTAENTRLNSKLSSSQLGDALAVNGFDSHHYPTANNSAKRQSVSRKPPQQQLQQSPQPQGHQQGSVMAHKTLRPNSDVFHHGQHQQHAQGAGAGGMSSRSLRDRNSYVAPMAPHPALQPNYQSPSKQRAAELYAKANSRPISQFRPLNTKKSSFDKESEGANGSGQQPKVTRTTLRDNTSAPQTQPQPSTVPQSDANAHRILSSSESESPTKHRFTSRIADSDDEEVPQLAAHSAAENHPVEQAPALAPVVSERHTLRQPKEEEKPPKGKKKFGKLRKLFGRKNELR